MPAKIRLPRRLPIAFIVCSIFGAEASNVSIAATLLVSDCGDGLSSGTLRHTIGVAPDNSIIQIPLTCSRITLTQGHIFVPDSLTNLYIVGQSPSETVIDGGAYSSPKVYDRVFNSAMPGTLGLSQLTITNGISLFANYPLGGCIYASGSVGLNHAVVTHCEVSSTSGGHKSKGGGIYALGSVALLDSQVTNNVVYGAQGEYSEGGGIFAGKGVAATSSTISGNRVYSGSNANYSKGGGFYALGGGNTLISKSTISNNRADRSAAFAVYSLTNTCNVHIVNSTITHNTARQINIAEATVTTTITNSTVAYNRVGRGYDDTNAGLGSNYAIVANSSIFASNTADSGPANDVQSDVAITGSANLITNTSSSVPLGTLTSCPRLGHLSNNGGVTETIPLRANSPALDVGAANSATTDQRGTGFARTVGSGTDIGAYERQAGVVDDVVFFSEFESRCN